MLRFLDMFVADIPVKGVKFEGDDQNALLYHLIAFGPKINLFVDRARDAIGSG